MSEKKMRFAWLLIVAFCFAGCMHSASRVKVRSATPWEDAKRALAEGDSRGAAQFASQMLKDNRDPKAWSYGNCIHEANQILGLAALQQGHVADAKRYLLAAGRTPGSPQLDSFGPNMVLAQQLLKLGEKEAVLQYLDLVARFWATTSESQLKRLEQKTPGITAAIKQSDSDHQALLDQWKKQIKAGENPTLNNSAGLF